MILREDSITVAIVAPAKPPTKKAKKGILRDSTNNSIPRRSKPAVKRRSVLDEEKDSPGAGPQWKSGSACFLALYDDLVAKPDPAVHRDILRNTLRVPRQ